MRTRRTGFALSLGPELGPPGGLALELLSTPSRCSSEASNDFIRVIRFTSKVASARSRPLAHPLPLDRQTLRTQGATLFAPRGLAAAHTHPLSVPPELPSLLSCHLHQVLLAESRHWLQYVHFSWVGRRVGFAGSVGPDLPRQQKLVRGPRGGRAWSRPSPGWPPCRTSGSGRRCGCARRPAGPRGWPRTQPPRSRPGAEQCRAAARDSRGRRHSHQG
jgi:hypothetical protein